MMWRQHCVAHRLTREDALWVYDSLRHIEELEPAWHPVQARTVWTVFSQTRTPEAVASTTSILACSGHSKAISVLNIGVYGHFGPHCFHDSTAHRVGIALSTAVV